MKKISTLLLLLVNTISWSQNQVGINTENPKATLDIHANSIENAGILVPRLAKFPDTNPTIDQNGMLVFIDKEISNSAGLEGYYFWDHSNEIWQYIFQTKMINQNLYKTIANSTTGFTIPGDNTNTNSWFPSSFNELEAPDANSYLNNGKIVIGKTGLYYLYFTGAVYKNSNSDSATQTEVAVFINGIQNTNLVSKIPLPAADTGRRSVNHTISAVVSLQKGDEVSIQSRRTSNITTTMGNSSPYTLTLTYLD
jgi:hypothetical protein